MSLVSNVFSTTVQAAGTQSALAALAATMTNEQWVSFSMPDLSAATFSAVAPGGGEPCTINGFGNKLSWDSLHRKINYAGTAHTDTSVPVAGSGKFSLWDDQTNHWTAETYNGWGAGAPGHSYYHNAVNKTTGDLYFRSYNSRNVWRHPYGQTGEGAWNQAFSVIPNSGDWSNQVAAGHPKWFPELNGGAGGLVFYNQLGAAFTNAALTSWTWQSGTSEGGQYENWSAYTGGYVYFGGGVAALPSGNNSGMWRMNSSGTVTSLGTTPLQVWSNGNAILPHPTGSGLLLFESGNDQNLIGTTGALHVFDGSVWTGPFTHHIGVTNGAWAGCAIPEYGIVVIIQAQNFNAPSCIVYKPTPKYFTNFPLTANPLSESGKWINGSINPPRTNIQTDGVHAFGTMVSFDGTNFPDSIGCLASFPSNNQRVTATVFNGGGGGGVSGNEIELVLRCNLTGSTNTGYEIDIVGSSTEVVIVRWNGPDNSFTVMTAAPFTTNVSLADGAIYVAQIIGNLITVTCNGNTVVSNFDVTTGFGGGLVIASGTPGMGFWNETGSAANSTRFGWRNWTAVGL